MNYYTDLFSPLTYEAFTLSDRKISGFRESQRKMAEKIRPGDLLMCYMTKLSRWIGYLEVEEGPFIDRTSLFVPDDDPFVVRFKVKEHLWLPRDLTIPIQTPELFQNLTFTSGHEPGDAGWIGPLRRSLQTIQPSDGQLLVRALKQQAAQPVKYPVDEDVWRKLLPIPVQRGDRVVQVVVPEAEEPEEISAPSHDTEMPRTSYQVQAQLARIGEQMGFDIWIPKADRNGVLQAWKGGEERLLNALPLNSGETTIQTIERIDVLWLKRRSIVRAFEVEHTTAIYSGILRMADLLALQPNINIRLHIVAPEDRKQKVFDEIRRPVFSLLDHSPLGESCTFLSYDSIEEIDHLPYLQHMSASVLDEYAEQAE